MRGLVALTVVAGTLLLAGCSVAPTPTDTRPVQEYSSEEPDLGEFVEFYAEEVALPDGRTVICVIELSNTGNFECDWDHTQ